MFIFTELSNKTPLELMLEIKRLRKFAYQLDLEEAKEIIRGKYLNIFTRKRHI
jgi:hypothetical protein